MNLRLLVALPVAAALVIAGHASAAPNGAPASAAQPLPRLVFFMNPNGMPCQIQDRVLREMASELKGRAEVLYYKTTEQQDLPQFSKYGIRSLPALLVTDAAGRERRRAAPGIRSAEEIRILLKP